MSDEPSQLYDVIIIGGGPAGLTAAIYGSRSRLSTLLIEKASMGGLMRWTDEIDNYPGFLVIDPVELSEKMKDQTEKFGAKIVQAEAKRLEEENGTMKVVTDCGVFRGKSIIIAVGLIPRKLNKKGEHLPGVSYCAVCDGPLYGDMNIYVIGSGDSAMVDSIYLSKIAEEVNVIVVHEEPKLDAAGYLVERALSADNIKFVWGSVVEEILGEDGVEGIRIRDLKTNEIQELKGDAVFVKIGFIPSTEFLKGFVELTDKGLVKVYDESTLKTSRDGVFVAGDVRGKIQRQIITAAGDGCTAIKSVIEYLEEQKYVNILLQEGKMVIASFWDSSVPSSSQKSLLSKLSEKFGEMLKTFEIDLYAKKSIAERFQVKKIPTILMIKNGKELDRVSEKINLDELLEKMQSFL